MSDNNSAIQSNFHICEINGNLHITFAVDSGKDYYRQIEVNEDADKFLKDCIGVLEDWNLARATLRSYELDSDKKKCEGE